MLLDFIITLGPRSYLANCFVVVVVVVVVVVISCFVDKCELKPFALGMQKRRGRKFL
jgi:hypothetical protein